ncbi:MAG TPA: tetratricopeptide repeat protein [Bryobacteraceae bacterium]|nr:tetratricopeptide repeat protein [Bryobacteraceae bacterium]
MPLALAAVSAAPAATFSHDIAPIVYQKCAPCHHAGEAAPFSLLSYEDVKKRAALVATVTRSRYMPPWLPEQGYGDFEGERRLTPEQIATIAEWVKEGAPEGSPAETPPPPSFPSDWQLGTPDLVIQAPGAFELPASGSDVYWNCIFPLPITTRRWVRAVEIRPGERRLVHHANLMVDRMGSARAQEIAPGKGFPGMDVILMGSPFDPEGHLLFWKPGSPPHVEPDGFSLRLDPGNELVLNMHLQPSGKPEEVRPSIGLYFTDKPQTRFPLVFELENDNALDIPAGAHDFEISDDFTLPMAVDVLAVYPHAHYLGRLLEAWATLPDGSKRWLIRIPDWDQNWQAVYYYREPVTLPQGAVLHMRYHYDNSAANARNPNHPPRRVRAGNLATDEMGHLWLEVLPRGPGDRRRELQEAVIRHRLDKNPDDFEAHMNLGAIELTRLNPQGAVTELREAVRLDPDRPEPHNMLGVALGSMGRNADAIGEYMQALQLRPGFASARYNLAVALAKAGKVDDAVEQLRKILADNPEDPSAKRRLADALTLRGVLLLRDGKRGDAVAQFEEALKLDPENEEARKNRDQALGK